MGCKLAQSGLWIKARQSIYSNTQTVPGGEELKSNCKFDEKEIGTEAMWVLLAANSYENTVKLLHTKGNVTIT